MKSTDCTGGWTVKVVSGRIRSHRVLGVLGPSLNVRIAYRSRLRRGHNTRRFYALPVPPGRASNQFGCSRLDRRLKEHHARSGRFRLQSPPFQTVIFALVPMGSPSPTASKIRMYDRRGLGWTVPSHRFSPLFLADSWLERARIQSSGEHW